MPLIDAQGAVLGPAPNAEAAVDMDKTPLESLLDADSVTLAFASHKDGRAFSWAARLLSRGFRGRLLGVGPIGLDRLSHGFRCGFAALYLSEEELHQLKPVHLGPFPGSYQPALAQRGGLTVDVR